MAPGAARHLPVGQGSGVLGEPGQDRAVACGEVVLGDVEAAVAAGPGVEADPGIVLRGEPVRRAPRVVEPGRVARGEQQQARPHRVHPQLALHVAVGVLHGGEVGAGLVEDARRLRALEGPPPAVRAQDAELEGQGPLRAVPLDGEGQASAARLRLGVGDRVAERNARVLALLEAGAARADDDVVRRQHAAGGRARRDGDDVDPVAVHPPAGARGAEAEPAAGPLGVGRPGDRAAQRGPGGREQERREDNGDARRAPWRAHASSPKASSSRLRSARSPSWRAPARSCPRPSRRQH